MNEYRPTTENIRQTFAYVQAGLDDDDGYPFVMHVHVEEFDRWLAAEKAEAWDEGALWSAVECGAIPDERVQWLTASENPYREAS